MASIPRILQIGVGRWGANHLRVWKQLEREGLCKLAGFIESDDVRRHEIEATFRVESERQICGLSHFDAIDIVTPASTHATLVIEALRNGKHVLVEKPMAMTSEEYARIIAQHSGTDAILMAGHLFHYNPSTEKLIAAANNGSAGTLRLFRGIFTRFMDPEPGVGILQSSAMHFLSLSIAVFGRMPDSVTAVTGHHLGLPWDDYALVVLQYGQAQAIIEADYFSPGQTRSILLVGSSRTMEADLLRQVTTWSEYTHEDINGRLRARDDGSATLSHEFKEPLDLELRHFLACIRTGSVPRTGLEDAINTHRIIEAAYRSAQIQSTVVL